MNSTQRVEALLLATTLFSNAVMHVFRRSSARSVTPRP